MVDHPSLWQYNAEHQVVQLANRHGQLNLRTRAFEWAHQSVTGQVLQLLSADCDAQLTDHFARGPEYVACYANMPASQSTAEIRWRFEQTNATRWQIDWLASLQTDRSEASIECTCRSQWNRYPFYVRTARHGWRRIDTQVFTADVQDQAQGVAVPIDGNRVYAEFIWPSDYDGLYVSRGMEYSVTAWRLAASRLERGVIRRLRVRALFADEGLDFTRLDNWYTEFTISPVPLTA